MSEGDWRKWHTYNFDTDHRDTVVVQLVLEQQHFIEEHDLLPGFKLLQIDPVRRLGHLKRSTYYTTVFLWHLYSRIEKALAKHILEQMEG